MPVQDPAGYAFTTPLRTRPSTRSPAASAAPLGETNLGASIAGIRILRRPPVQNLVGRHQRTLELEAVERPGGGRGGQHDERRKRRDRTDPAAVHVLRSLRANYADSAAG